MEWLPVARPWPGRHSVGSSSSVAVPREVVRARMVDERGRFARAVVEDVVEPAVGRVEPPCPYVPAGCGGCSWQHIAPEVQRALKRQIVLDSLERVGRVTIPW